MAGPNCQASQGKMAQHRLWARHGFYRRERLRKVVHEWESPVGVELVLEHRNFCFEGGAVVGNGSISQVRPEDKMATDLQNGDIITLSFPHFFFTNDEGRD
jgi:hypothetical protein